MSGNVIDFIAFGGGGKRPQPRRTQPVRSSAFILSRLALTASAIALLLALTPRSAMADSVEDTAQVCSGCHGEKGIPTDKTIPNIWGQRREYILKQLLDFKSGHRKNDTMAAIVDSLTKTDMEALATYFSSKEWPNLGQAAAPADVQTKALDIIGQLNCRGCHQDHFQGDYVRPRLRGQQDEYLLKTMTDFHTGDRSNFAPMAALMKSLNDDELKPVVTYLAGLPSDGPAVGQK